MKSQLILWLRKEQIPMTNKNKKSKWGYGITLLYVGFVLFMLAIVFYVSFQDFQMVEDDYYQKELVYQDQIDKLERTRKNNADVIIKIADNGNILLKFPVMNNMDITGDIKLFRPSNVRMDIDLPVELDTSGTQEIETTKMARGYWKVKIDWMADSVEYYSQSPLFLN